MAKNPKMILSQMHEILSGTLPLCEAYDQYPKFGSQRATQKFERIFEFSLEELSQRNKVQTIVDIIKELKSCPLNLVPVRHVNLLESLVVVINKYLSIKLKINSLNDFLKTQMAEKIEYLQTKEIYTRLWSLEEDTGKEAMLYRSQVIDTKHKLDDLKAKWSQMGFQAGCSQSELMKNDIELLRLEKEHDRLMKLCYDKVVECKKLFEKKKEMSGALKGMILNSFDKLANLKENEKQLAYQELASIESSWGFMRISGFS